MAILSLMNGRFVNDKFGVGSLPVELRQLGHQTQRTDHVAAAAVFAAEFDHVLKLGQHLGGHVFAVNTCHVNG